jgi:tetratricopeptide (TPR) repeat protein
MTEDNKQLELLFIELAKKLGDNSPLLADLRVILKNNSQMVYRMIQNNKDNSQGFQTLVNGIAQIGPHYHLYGDGLQEVINSLIQERKPKSVGILQNLPYKSTPEFVGRKVDLETIYREFHKHQKLQDENPVVFKISGMPGVGKTELALQYAYYHLAKDTYSGGICWLEGRLEEQSKGNELGTKIVAFVEGFLDLKSLNVPDLYTKVSSCWRRWLENVEGEILIIIDDVNDYQKIMQFFPSQSSRFKILITTTVRLDPPLLILNVLQEDDALNLLRQSIGEEKILQELANANKLCQRLGYLPLALVLVGRHIRKRELSIEKMLEQLEKKGLKHNALNNNDPSSTLDIKQGVTAVFEVSWGILTDKAKELAYLLSLFALAPIPWLLVEHVNKGQNTEDLEEARWELTDLHLVQDKGVYCLHQLIREFFKEKLKNLKHVGDQLQDSFCLTMVSVAVVKQIPESPTQQDIQVVSLEMPHMLEIITNKIILTNNAVSSDEDFCLFFVSLGRLYTAQCSYEEAKICYEHYLLNAKERFGADSLEVASSQNNLADIYKYLGHYDDAKKYYHQALELTIKISGDDNLNVATIMNNLALLYFFPRSVDKETYLYIGSYRQLEEYYLEARKLFRQALKIRKFHLEENHLIVAQSLNNLGMLYAELSNINYYSCYVQKSERLLKKAFSIRKNILNKEHPDIAESQNNLAYLYQRIGRYSEAESLFLAALALNKRLLGEKHIMVAYGLWNLGEFYHNNKYQKNKAKHLLQSALDIFKAYLPNDHLLVASASQSLKKWGYSNLI